MDKTIKLLCKVTVVMPVYNAEKHLKQAIESILNQTYRDFILLIINDGSTDDSENIILSYTDNRIKYLKNEKNTGLISTLNHALYISDTEYVIRMDADDISMPERIQEQVCFMEKNQSIWVCGTQVEYFGKSQKTSSFPTSHELIKSHLLFGNCIAHPSVIMRLKKIKDSRLLYSHEFIHIEDYELWIRVSKIGQLANINKTLLKYRIEGQNITINNWNTRNERLKQIYQILINELGLLLTEENLKLHIELSGNSEVISKVKTLRLYSKKIINANKTKNTYPIKSLNIALQQIWKHLFFLIVKNGIFEIISYWLYTKSISLKQIRYILGYYKSKIICTLR